MVEEIAAYLYYMGIVMLGFTIFVAFTSWDIDWFTIRFFIAVSVVTIVSKNLKDEND